RRREPAPPLRADPAPLARALRARGGAGGGDVRRGLRAGLAALPGRLGGRLHHRLPPALPAHVRARGRGHPLDAGRALPVAMLSADAIVVGGGPAGSTTAARLRAA